MSVAERARAAIRACPGHWTPATLARQLRVDVVELEAALSTMLDLRRDAWRGQLALPSQPRRSRRYRPVDEYRAVLRRFAGQSLTLAELAGALECSPRRARDLAVAHGARCLAAPGTRGALWRMP